MTNPADDVGRKIEERLKGMSIDEWLALKSRLIAINNLMTEFKKLEIDSTHTEPKKPHNTQLADDEGFLLLLENLMSPNNIPRDHIINDSGSKVTD